MKLKLWPKKSQSSRKPMYTKRNLRKIIAVVLLLVGCSWEIKIYWATLARNGNGQHINRIKRGTCCEGGQHCNMETRQTIRPHRMSGPIREEVNGRHPDWLPCLLGDLLGCDELARLHLPMLPTFATCTWKGSVLTSNYCSNCLAE